MPTFSVNLQSCVVEIECSNSDKEIHRINAVAKLREASHRVLGVTLDSLRIEATILKQVELTAEQKSNVGYGNAIWFTSIAGTKAAALAFPHTLAVHLYLPDCAFNLIWSKVIANNFSDIRVVFAIPDNPKSIYDAWKCELDQLYKIQFVRIEYGIIAEEHA